MTFRDWAQVGEGPTQAPLSGRTQAPEGTFLPSSTRWKRTCRERHHRAHKGTDYQNYGVGVMTNEHRVACTGMKDQEMTWWIYATWDVETPAHQTQVLASALRSQHDKLADMLHTQAEPMTLLTEAVLSREKPRGDNHDNCCFWLGGHGHFRKNFPNCLTNKGARPKTMPLLSQRLPLESWPFDKDGKFIEDSSAPLPSKALN